MITVIAYLGTFVFALSGILAGRDKNLDLFGMFVLGLVTSIGGGTIRDLLIGNTPVAWLRDVNYMWIVTLAMPVAYFFGKYIIQFKRSLFLFDTIGIGLFTVLGIQKTLEVGLSAPIALVMGVVSAVFGGVLRDVLSNEIPLIFRKEIYATACLVGGLVFFGTSQFIDENYAMILCIGTVITIRICALRYRWTLSPSEMEKRK